MHSDSDRLALTAYATKLNIHFTGIDGRDSRMLLASTQPMTAKGERVLRAFLRMMHAEGVEIHAVTRLHTLTTEVEEYLDLPLDAASEHNERPPMQLIPGASA